MSPLSGDLNSFQRLTIRMGNWSLPIDSILLLADEAAKGDQPDFFTVFGPPFMIMMILYYVLVVLPKNKDRSGRESFLDQLKKNDQVVTIGGIYGTVTGFSADGTQVTLRVDENARIRVRKTSIESLVNSETSEKKSNESSGK